MLVLVGVSDPGNTGTIIRAAEACAARCVVVVGGADPWAPKAVRASAGSVLRVPVVPAADAGAALEALRAAGAVDRGRRFLARASRTNPECSPRGAGPVALAFGSESRGLHQPIPPRTSGPSGADPDGGRRIESLNVAMAATLLAFEYRRRP